jgi:hypothetical protein
MSFATKKCFLQLICQLQMTFFNCKNWLQTIVFLLTSLAMINLPKLNLVMVNLAS